MKNSKTKTFDQQTKKTNFIMIIIIILSVIFLNIINSISVNQYSKTAASIKNLSHFYENVESASFHIKDFLYTENEESISNYEQCISSAYSELDKLMEASTGEVKWQFQMLTNMLENYESTTSILIDHMESESSLFNKLYNDFLEAGTLINQTSGDYYKIMSSLVDTQLESLLLYKRNTIVVSVLIISILIIWLIYYSKQLTSSIINPINCLLDNINQIKLGNYNISHVQGTSLEINALHEAVKDMAIAVQESIETTKKNSALEKQILEWKNENLKKDELLAQSELKMLQNQINPHFLFNTLNTIYKLALQEGAEEAADILLKTSELLRYGLDNQSKLSDINSEVKMIQHYIEIQKKRLGERVDFKLEFLNEKIIGEKQIPAMILQPLVENSIKHGLKDCSENGIIEILLGGNNSYIYISINDNGGGISAEDLDHLIINNYQTTNANNLGLYNVIRRLEMYFQDNVSISINSDLGCGFEVLIKILL